jgi:Dolichyl-phosphate-mannose-protein mannosyltransferase
MEASFPGDQGKLLRLAAAGLLAALFLGALAVSWTIPFQEWDAYSIGTWSRFIADGDAILSPKADQIAHQRPLVPVPQGLIWRWLGHPSMRAGRMLSLSYSMLLVVVTFLLARRLKLDRTEAWLAAFLAGASPLVTEKVSATLSDIPSAALFWSGILTMLLARERRSLVFWLLTGILWSLSLLGKVTALGLCAGFIATTIAYGISRRWRWKPWLAMAAGLGLPGYGVYRYWNRVRAPFSWPHFLYGWGGAYYDGLARSLRLRTLLHANWFGIFLTLIFGAALISWLSSRSRRLTLFLLVAGGVWAVAARLASSTGLRDYGPTRLDVLFAGIPAIVVVIGFAVALFNAERSPSFRAEAELLLVSAAYFAVWLLKLNYDRRFLVGILPPIAVCASRWLRAVWQFVIERRSPILSAAALVVFSAVAWEGARLMDRGFYVFSKGILAINQRHGLSPEAKMDEIFGDSMRIITEAQKLVASDPHLRVISPDTRLAFFFGTHIDAFYATPANIANYDFLIWVNNSGIVEQYKTVYKIPEPLDALKKTGRLSEIDKSAEYELYRVSRN